MVVNSTISTLAENYEEERVSESNSEALSRRAVRLRSLAGHLAHPCAASRETKSIISGLGRLMFTTATWITSSGPMSTTSLESTPTFRES